LDNAPVALNIVLMTGAATAIFASFLGAFQYDLKRVIAYSTCSQLGYMVLACGLSKYNLAMFHLVNHAFFKALLFLSAGSVIHAFADEQDMRRMGGLFAFMPFTYICMLIGNLGFNCFSIFFWLLFKGFNYRSSLSSLWVIHHSLQRF
jgi:NADH-ubiquinone oxidoreductase chain 5